MGFTPRHEQHCRKKNWCQLDIRRSIFINFFSKLPTVTMLTYLTEHNSSMYKQTCLFLSLELPVFHGCTVVYHNTILTLYTSLSQLQNSLQSFNQSQHMCCDWLKNEWKIDFPIIRSHDREKLDGPGFNVFLLDK